jgi:hypothetical protein
VHRSRQYESPVQLAMAPEWLEVVFWMFIIWFAIVGIFIFIGE